MTKDNKLHINLTDDLLCLLNEILDSDMNTHGYTELITQTIKSGEYTTHDRGWLNVVRSKWIRHIKKNR